MPGADFRLDGDWITVDRAWRQLRGIPHWVVSDTHFGDAAISRYADRPADAETLVRRRWEATVGCGDRVLHLGDVFFNAPPPWLKELKGRIRFIRGNHDEDSQLAALCALGWIEEQPFRVIFNSWTVYVTHQPVRPPLPEGSLNVHGHVHNNCPEISPAHINVSVEVQDYRPQRFRDQVARRIRVLESPDARRFAAGLRRLWSQWPEPDHDRPRLRKLRLDASAFMAEWR